MIDIIISAVIHTECTRILERTNEGRLEANYKGIKFGRKWNIDKNKIKVKHNKGTGTT